MPEKDNFCCHNIPLQFCNECSEMAEAIVNTIAKAIDDLEKVENPRDPTRPYNGQPHTDCGERGKTMVTGLTMRDIQDCIVIGFLYAAGKGELVRTNACDYRDIFKCDNVDQMAVCQNTMCEIERRMGIFPNVPKLEAPDGK